MATVYIPLLDDGVNVWRPVQAEHVGGDLYRLTDNHRTAKPGPFPSAMSSDAGRKRSAAMGASTN